ncbi:unnamed protein product [Adineta steineri]|uniref:Cullin family profile domain-containing protein n=1 Tax=Adineta steineri TaxID=433720 RepID=A0A819K723_9BILA|nr:unnamed protein product [Adineta steineri]CAF3943348.1 unnamed protein product [Adineta steineri]
MLIWQEIVLKPISNRLANSCFSIIKIKCNNHLVTNTQLIEDVAQSYMCFNFHEDMILWVNNERTTISPLNIYTELFEKPILQKTKEFHRIEAANELLSKEEVHAHLYLTSISSQSLLIMIEEIYIQYCLDDIRDEVKNMLNKENYEGLKRLSEILRHMPITKKELKITVKNHIYQAAYQTIEQIDRSNVEACAQLINTNAVSDTDIKSYALLAYHCDKLLRNKTKNLPESEFEENLRNIMIVFNYIDDKDAFELLYRKLLLKRIINQLTSSDDYEELIVSKLKEVCGHEYTVKLQRIFEDINVSKTLIVEYKNYCDDHHVTDKIDCSVLVISSNSCSLAAPSNFVLPIELQSRLDSFTKFYNDRHDGRKLTLLHRYSKGELQTLFTSQKYILQVSTYQMVLLLLFNHELNLTVERIQDKTQIELKLLLEILLSLLKNKLLICTDIHEDELVASNIKMNYSIRLATDFKSKKLRINLNVPLKSVERKDIDSFHRTIEEDRKMIIQATIVRIMKARQTLKHTLLMQEVIQQLSSRFKPQIPLIKKCIDILIEKEYLERQSDQNDILRYLA